jgi:energy-coupling factor transporter ATP-binding protein EcfA2
MIGRGGPIGDPSPARHERRDRDQTTRMTKDYGAGRRLFDLDPEVQRGKILRFLGPNGAGKTTTMRLLLDRIRPTSGSARLLEPDSHEIRRRVGLRPGELAPYPMLSGEAILDHPADLRGGVDRRLRDTMAERFDAPLDRHIRELSTVAARTRGLSGAAAAAEAPGVETGRVDRGSVVADRRRCRRQGRAIRWTTASFDGEKMLSTPSSQSTLKCSRPGSPRTSRISPVRPRSPTWCP